MAYTYPKKGLRVKDLESRFLDTIVRDAPEGASQTFVPGAPVVFAAGLIVEAADPATAILGFSQQPGQNLATPLERARFIPALDGVGFYANFLAAGGAGTNAWAAADLGVVAGRDLEKAAVGPGGDVIWFVGDAAAAVSVRMISDRSDHVKENTHPNAEIALPGDLNARVLFTTLPAVRTFA